MGDFGFKISEEGVDVKTATDKQLVLSSKFDTIKIAKTIDTQHTQSGASETLSIAHGLGYAPGYLFFVKNPGETTRWYGVVGESPDIDRWWDLGIDATDLQIFLDGVDTDVWNIKSFFFAEESQGSGSGNLAQEDYGMKVSKPGADIRSAIADSDFLLNTRMETIKIISVIDQTITYTTSPARAEVEVNHNMPFTPAFFGMVEMPFATAVDPPFGTKYYTVPFIQVGNTEVGCYVTSTKLGFFVENISNATFNFHVAILGNKLE